MRRKFKKRLLSLTAMLMGLVVPGWGQDSIPGYSHLDSYFFSKLLEGYQGSGAYLSRIPVKDYTTSALYYGREGGGFRQGAEPAVLDRIGVLTEGLYHSDKGLVFYGTLDIRKTYYHNLKWNLSHELPEKGKMADPHYYAVAKGAHWSNQAYTLHGGLVLPLISDLLALNIEAEYLLFNKYRSDYDPRLEITYNRLALGGDIAYRPRPAQQWSLGYRYGQADIDHSISWANRDRNNVPFRHDTYVKWVAGYGTLLNRYGDEIRKDHRQQELRGGYVLSSGRGQLLCDARISKQVKTTFRNSSPFNDSPTFAEFKVMAYSLRLSRLRFLGENRAYRIALRAEGLDGTNHLSFRQGKTYSAVERDVQADIGFLKLQDDQSTDWDVGTSAAFSKVGQEDALSATRTDFSSVEAGAYALKAFPVQDKVSLTAALRASYRLNLSSTLEDGNATYLAHLKEDDYAGMALRDFYTEVVYPDHYYNTVNRCRFSPEVSLHLKKRKKGDTLLRLRSDYELPLRKRPGQGSTHRYTGAASLILSY